jgi:hypothetical protein
MQLGTPILNQTELRKRAMNYILRKICSRPRADVPFSFNEIEKLLNTKRYKKLDQEKRSMTVVEIVNNFESVGSF